MREESKRNLRRALKREQNTMHRQAILRKLWLLEQVSPEGRKSIPAKANGAKASAGRQSQ